MTYARFVVFHRERWGLPSEHTPRGHSASHTSLGRSHGRRNRVAVCRDHPSHFIRSPPLRRVKYRFGGVRHTRYFRRLIRGAGTLPPPLPQESPRTCPRRPNAGCRCCPPPGSAMPPPRRRLHARRSSATTTASCSAVPSAAWPTRLRSSPCRTTTMCTPGSRTRSRWRRSAARWARWSAARCSRPNPHSRHTSTRAIS